MLLRLKLCALLLLFSTVLFGQSKIEGIIHNEENSAVSQATIILKNPLSGDEKSVSSKDDGSFSLEIKPGRYDLKITL